MDYYVSPKHRRIFTDGHGVISQKSKIFKRKIFDFLHPGILPMPLNNPKINKIGFIILIIGLYIFHTRFLAYSLSAESSHTFLTCMSKP